MRRAVLACFGLAILASPASADRATLFPRAIPDDELTTGSIDRRASAVTVAPDRAILPPDDFTFDIFPQFENEPASRDERILTGSTRPRAVARRVSRH